MVDAVLLTVIAIITLSGAVGIAGALVAMMSYPKNRP